jgi:amino acid transporter
MTRRLLTYLIALIGFGIYTSLIIFVVFLDVIPHMYYLQERIAWFGFFLFLILLLVLFFFIYKGKNKQTKNLWTLVILFLLAFLSMFYRLCIKQDGAWQNSLSIYRERTYDSTWVSSDKQVELYIYSDYNALFGSTTSIWQRKNKSIFMHKTWDGSHCRIDSILEFKNEIKIYAIEIDPYFQVIIELNKQTNEKLISKKSRKQIDQEVYDAIMKGM